MGVRKTYRALTDVERDRFVQALFQLKADGVIDRFARMHANHFFMNIHRSSHFLPWHREMLLRIERRLQQVHPDITIPYWASAVRRSTTDPLWANNFLGQFNSAWNLGRALNIRQPDLTKPDKLDQRSKVVIYLREHGLTHTVTSPMQQSKVSDLGVRLQADVRPQIE
jgi:hypothetical protein